MWSHRSILAVGAYMVDFTKVVVPQSLFMVFLCCSFFIHLDFMKLILDGVKDGCALINSKHDVSSSLSVLAFLAAILIVNDLKMSDLPIACVCLDIPNADRMQLQVIP